MRESFFLTSCEERQQNIENVSILHQNIQCLSNKMNQLDVVLRSHRVDILLLSEHWQDICQLKQLSFGKHILKSFFCRTTNKHGGVAIFVHNRFKTKPRDDIGILSIPNVLEMCAVELVSITNIVIIALYRPAGPLTDDFFNILNALFDVLSREDKFIVIGGDFNVDVLVDAPVQRAFFDLIHSNNLNVTIDVPTRITPTSSSCIDNIITNLPFDLYNSRCIEFNLSDHYSQLLTVHTTVDIKSNPFIFKRKFCVNSIVLFNNYLARETWLAVYECNCPDTAFSKFIDIFKYYTDICFPVVKISSTYTNSDWVSADIIELKNNLMFLRFLSQKYPTFKDDFLKYEKFYKSIITIKKKEKNDNFIISAKNKSRAVWSVIRNNSACCRGNRVLPDAFSNLRDLCNAFNQHFSNYASYDGAVSDGFLSSRDNNIVINLSSKSFYISPIDESDILGVIRNLNNSQAAGHDTVSAYIVKKCAEMILGPLHYLINFSFSKGIFPSELKIAHVKPLYKKGDINDFSNYRPISILSTFAKIYESLMNKKLISFFREFNLFFEGQHGFLPNRSINTALSGFVSRISACIDGRTPCLAMFIDLAKAFDNIDHDIMIYKLERYGVNGVALQWFKSYLCNRHQFVVVDEFKSDSCSINRGIPQGSVLGPSLFLIFINDLPLYLESSDSLTLYADDINIILKSATLNELFLEANSFYLRLCDWMKVNKLTINKTKTHCILFQNNLKYKVHSISLNHEVMELVQSTKLLGVVFDQNLKWNDQVSNLCRELASICYALLNLRRSCSLAVLKIYYHSNFSSKMNYGIIHWGCGADVNRVFLLQKRALRIMYNLPWRESCRELFKSEKFLTFYDCYIFEVLCYVFKHKSEFSFKYPHKYNSRNDNYLLPPKHTTSQFQKSLSFLGCKIYNKLPNRFKAISSYKLFRSSVKNYLLEISCYSVNDYFLF